MITTLPSDNDDLVSFFAHDEHNGDRARFARRLDTEAMSPSSTEVSDDSSLTNDDLVVLSDLFGFSTSGSHPSAATSTPARPRTRKRPRSTQAVAEDGSVLPKSQQQRQKLEIECLKKQVVELQATIERLQTRKLARERQALEGSQKLDAYDNSSVFNDPSKNHVVAAHQLEEQNEKLRSQVTTHLGQLKQLEHMARTRYLTNAIPEPMQFAEHSTAAYYSASC
ncbi:hypothetical protein PHYPSEUDO_008917 [Phytophthora pseudosyringae]|uniref:Uncharacterized protein n=1 Tax=Phytophthora pseudosyringae TaxID=221518 RepID=A0A8T1VE00_9STRA|nr:hypothetical protein PHYPSEUDO_008917 [Phytophthora pseudosyringae]